MRPESNVNMDRLFEPFVLTRPPRLAHAITGRILSAPWFSQATTISCYLSMPTGEVDTSAITEAILASGNQLTFFHCNFHPY